MDRSKWEYKKLGEVATFINGDRGVNYPSQTDFVEVGIPFVNAGHLTNNKIDFSSMNYITREKFDKLGSGKIKKGDILFCLRGSLGKKAIADNLEEGAIASSLVIIRPSKIDTNFLSYYLESPSIKREILRSNNGSSQPNLSAKSVSQFVVAVPQIADQQRIVAELDCLNEMIAVKQEQLKEFDKLAQSIFYDMFLNEGNSSFERIDLKECVKEMHLGPFGSALKNEFFVPKEQGYCMVYEQQHAIKKTMDLPTRYVDEDKYRELERFVVGPGDILMSCRGTIGEVYIIPDNAPIGIIHPSLMKIRLNPTYIEKTYFVFLLSHIIKDKDSNGATIKMAITAKELGRESIPLPPLSLQQQFADKISAIEAQKELVKQSIAETQHLLDYTMEKYFGYD